MSSESVCFSCNRSSGCIPASPIYTKEIALFKKLVLDLGPSYRRKPELGDVVLAKFGANSHLCSTCLSSVVAVWRMQEKIVSIQKEINSIVRKVRNNLEVKTEEGVVEEESGDWPVFQFQETEREQIYDKDDSKIDVKFGVHVGLGASEKDFDPEGPRPPKKSKAFQLMPNKEVKSEQNSDNDDDEMNLNNFQYKDYSNVCRPEEEIPINAIDPTRKNAKYSCCLKPNCGQSWHPDIPKHITLHAVKDKWTDFIRTQKRDMSWTPTKNTKICSLHFYSAMFRMWNGRQEIEEWAMPMIETKNSTPPSQLLPSAPPSSTFSSETLLLNNTVPLCENDDIFLTPPPRNITPEPPASPPRWLPVTTNSRSCLSEEHCYSAPPRDEKLEKVQAELEHLKKNYRSLQRKLDRRDITNATLREKISK